MARKACKSGVYYPPLVADKTTPKVVPPGYEMCRIIYSKLTFLELRNAMSRYLY